MKIKTKKILFTILDIAVVSIAGCWCMWLVVYFSQSIDGAIWISSDYAIFERNYLVPLQIFGIALLVTVVSILLYRRLLKKRIIGKKYIILVLFNIIPFWIYSYFQILNMIQYWEIY
ncbi:MAG: hypothetical protein IJX24_01770 [Oscillospiraceae bacterium]|nr:hypothetical protein [Oscillospiraceae bacterium]